MLGETWYGKTSTNKLEHYSKLPRLHMQAKLRLLCRVGEPIKLANVMGVTISASVQLFISSLLTHFPILMRWHSSSRIRTVGWIIVCLIPRCAGCQHRYQGMYNERWAFQWAQPVHTAPPFLDPSPPLCSLPVQCCCLCNTHDSLQLGSLFNTLQVCRACLQIPCCFPIF